MPRFFMQQRFATDEGGTTLYKWSNTWHVIAENVGGAANAGIDLWVNWLNDAAFSSMWLYEVYARDETPDTDVFTVVSVDPGDARGTIDPGVGSERYARSIVTAITIPVAASRPSRKFWRPPLYEGVVVGGLSVSTGISDAIIAAFNAGITGMASALVDPQGQVLQSGVVLRLSTRRLGDEATADLPAAPPVG